jgi:hypothetical protein
MTVIDVILNSLVQLVFLPAKSVHSFSKTNKQTKQKEREREVYVTFHRFCATRYFKTLEEFKLSSSES